MSDWETDEELAENFQDTVLWEYHNKDWGIEGNLQGFVETKNIVLFENPDMCVSGTVNPKPPCLVFQKLDEEILRKHGVFAMDPVDWIPLSADQAKRIREFVNDKNAPESRGEE